MGKVLSLLLCLAGFWFALSGHTEPLVLGLGAVSVIGVVALSNRMGVIGRESNLIAMLPAILRFAPVLLFRIVTSNLQVAAIILGFGREFAPSLIRVDTARLGVLGETVYANSVTLTPGTVTVDVGPASLLVHSLTKEDTAGLSAQEKDLIDHIGMLYEDRRSTS